MKNYADLGGCYPPQPSASADNTLLDLHNSSYHTQPHPIIANSYPHRKNSRHFREVKFTRLTTMKATHEVCTSHRIQELAYSNIIVDAFHC